jgi:hypothetical protein
MSTSDHRTLETATETNYVSSYVKAELRSLQHSLFLVIREEHAVPYKIENRSISCTMYYRQRGCSGHPWQSLKSGQSGAYAWEEPLKAKRLTVRVSIDNFFLGLDDDEYEALETSSVAIREGRDKSLIRKVKDEEEAVFSPSISVRLEEIGFKEYLTCPLPGKGGTEVSKVRYLDLSVDVVGATRVLVVQDASSEDDTLQLERHLLFLQRMVAEEDMRIQDLIQLNENLNSREDPAGFLEGAKSIMMGFPEDPMIKQCDQLVIQILEANGLSPDTFVGTCNPYCEVSLKDSNRPRRLFRRKVDVRRTYYVKKTVNPTWNCQSFVFDVPQQAVEAPRGHSVVIWLRNFQLFGRHTVLGRAQVELLSVRNQKPLVGWFPLAGRTGRHELENPLSHWGRGSVKLRIQWIHSPSSLLDYFTLMAEKRLFDLQQSLQGMGHQLLNKKDAEAIKRDGIDGFKRVRVQDLVAFSAQIKKRKLAPPTLLLQGGEKLEKGISDSPQTSADESFRKQKNIKTLSQGQSLKRLNEPVIPLRRDVNVTDLSRDQVMHKVESIILDQRHHKSGIKLSDYPSRPFATNDHTVNVGSLSVSRFRSWSAAHSIFQDNDLMVEVGADVVDVRLKSTKVTRRAELSKLFDATRAVSLKLSIPELGPSTMSRPALDFTASFLRARTSFERAAKRKVKSVLHPGGWLMIRPYTALNISEAYNGMFVKLTYGPEMLVTESVDAKVCPTWHRRKPVDSNFNELNYESNDMLIHIAPRKTSGSIRLAVVGEKSHPNLGSKSELGVIHLPLGSTIAACIDTAEAIHEAGGKLDKRNPAKYTRWFPLMDPKDVVPVEGDWGLSTRPPESEKSSDSLFKEYFAPCLQLSLLWFPDSDDDSVSEGNNGPFPDMIGQNKGDAVSESNGSFAPFALPTTIESTVTNYLYADIGHLSAALIDSQRAFELFSLSASDIDIRYWTTKAKTRYGVSVGWLQVDQQNDNAREPVVLAPTPMAYIGPVIQLLAVKDNVRSIAEVVSFDFIDVSVSEFDLTLEESTVFELFDFINSVQLRRGFLVKATQAATGRTKTVGIGDDSHTLFIDDPSPVHEDLLSLLVGTGASEAAAETKFYIEQLFLGVVKVNLSYLKGKKQTWELTSQGGFVEKKTGSKIKEIMVSATSPFHVESDALISWTQRTSDEELQSEGTGKTIQSFPQLLAALFPNVSDAPIRLQGKALNHIFESPSEILLSIKKFYVNETLRQIYRIIGSLDFVGNPTMLFTSFFTGMRDLVMTPSQAFMKKPTDASGVSLGVAKGTLSLFSHSASGFFGFWAKVSAAAGQGLALVTLDEEYRVWHRDKIVTEATNLNREWKRRGVQSAQAILARPLGDILIGVVFGVSGIILSPIKGYKRNRGRGVVTGLASGAIGVVVKPIIGVLDAMTHFASSIHDIAKSVNVLDKRRQPALKLRLAYTFGLMSILRPYDQVSARAVYLLKQFSIKKSKRSSKIIPETLVHVEVLPNVEADTYMMLTSHRVILVRLRKDPLGVLTTSLCWEVALTGEPVISSRLSEHGHNGVALTLTVTKPTGYALLTDGQIAGSKAVSFDPSEKLGLDDSDEMDTSADGTAGNDTEIYEIPSNPDAMAEKIGLSGFNMETGDGQYHGTGRGEEGQMLEWFTVLAEYQNRGQLARLHNAITCVAGNFDAIIRDPSLGRPGSSEGYTSFGMFFFAPDDSPAKSSSDQSLIEVLECLPWMDDQTFSTIIEYPPMVQQTYLKALRKNWNFDKEVAASMTEGGPDWLTLARAQAIHLDSSVNPVEVLCRQAIQETNIDVVLDSTFTLEKGGKTGRMRRLKKWASSPMPTLPDYGLVEKGAKLIPFTRKRDKKVSFDGDGDKDRQSEGGTMPVKLYKSNDDVDGGGSFKSTQMDFKNSSRLDTWQEGNSSSELDSPLRYRRGSNTDSISDLGGSSYHTARTSSASNSFEDKDSFVTAASSASSSLQSRAKRLPVPLLKSIRSIRGPSKLEATHRKMSEQEDWTTDEDNEVRAISTPRSSERRAAARLERMESLMERLLIFSSEQALRPSNSDGGGGDDALRSEIAELRAQVQRQTQRNIDVVQLRREIAELKKQMMGDDDYPVTIIPLKNEPTQAVPTDGCITAFPSENLQADFDAEKSMEFMTPSSADSWGRKPNAPRQDQFTVQESTDSKFQKRAVEGDGSSMFHSTNFDDSAYMGHESDVFHSTQFDIQSMVYESDDEADVSSTDSVDDGQGTA